MYTTISITTRAFISIANINIETLLETHIYSIMILIMVMHLFIKTDAQHYYNMSYKIPIGVYMIQSQPKAIRYPLTWTLKPCLTPCILLAIYLQLLKLIMSHTKLYSTRISVLPYKFILIMEQHLPFSHLVLKINTPCYKNIPQQEALHPST